MSIRAKVSVQQVIPLKGWAPEGKEPEKYGENITAFPVYGNGEENKSYSEATPSGRIELTITNKNAFGFFVEGKEYYVDITPAEGGS